MTTWFSFLLLLFPIFVVGGLRALSETGQWENLGFLIVPPFMIAFGIGFLHFGQRSWNEDKAHLEQFLRSQLAHSGV
jgi:hypothetical protein